MMLGNTGAFLTGKLPYDAEVEYLESTGRQWIDTGVVISKNTVWITDCIYKSNGAEGINGTGYFFAGGNGGKIYAGIYARVLYSNMNIGIRHTIKLDSTSGLYVDGELKSAYVMTSSGNANMHLFNTSVSGGNVYYISKVDYGDKIWVDGVLVRNFLPVRFTNELGQSEGAMYDRANPTVGMNPDGSPRTDGLYRNRGTGAFTWVEKSA